MFGIFRNCTDGVCFAGDGIAQVTSVDFAEIQVLPVSHSGQESVQYLVCIASSQVNITTGVTAFQSFYFYFKEKVSCGDFYFFITKLCNGVDTSGTSDKDFSFIFGVEVQQNITAHETFFQLESSGQTSFFIYGKQAFQRAVLDAVIRQNSQFGSYTDTVISSEGSSFGFQPFSVYFCFDRVGKEVVLYIIVLFTHHVDVRLQYDSLKVFFARSGRLFDQYVSCFVYIGLQVMFCSECLQVGNYFLFLLGRTRHLADFLKILEYASRLKVFFFHAVFFYNRNRRFILVPLIAKYG